MVAGLFQPVKLPENDVAFLKWKLLDLIRKFNATRIGSDMTPAETQNATHLLQEMAFIKSITGFRTTMFDLSLTPYEFARQYLQDPYNAI